MTPRGWLKSRTALRVLRRLSLSRLALSTWMLLSWMNRARKSTTAATPSRRIGRFMPRRRRRPAQPSLPRCQTPEEGGRADGEMQVDANIERTRGVTVARADAEGG